MKRGLFVVVGVLVAAGPAVAQARAGQSITPATDRQTPMMQRGRGGRGNPGR